MKFTVKSRKKILNLDHVKIQQEKDEKTNSLQPVPKKIYQINASLLSEKFIFYINILSWEFFGGFKRIFG